MGDRLLSRGSGPPPHVHEREDEAFYVLEGSCEVTVGNDRFDAREGFFIFAPRRECTLWVSSTSTATMILGMNAADRDARRTWSPQSTRWDGRAPWLPDQAAAEGGTTQPASSAARLDRA